MHDDAAAASRRARQLAPTQPRQVKCPHPAVTCLPQPSPPLLRLPAPYHPSTIYYVSLGEWTLGSVEPTTRCRIVTMATHQPQVVANDTHLHSSHCHRACTPPPWPLSPSCPPKPPSAGAESFHRQLPVFAKEAGRLCLLMMAPPVGLVPGQQGCRGRWSGPRRCWRRSSWRP